MKEVRGEATFDSSACLRIRWHYGMSQCDNLASYVFLPWQAESQTLGVSCAPCVIIVSRVWSLGYGLPLPLLLPLQICAPVM